MLTYLLNFFFLILPSFWKILSLDIECYIDSCFPLVLQNCNAIVFWPSFFLMRSQPSFILFNVVCNMLLLVGCFKIFFSFNFGFWHFDHGRSRHDFLCTYRIWGVLCFSDLSINFFSPTMWKFWLLCFKIFFLSHFLFILSF